MTRYLKNSYFIVSVVLTLLSCEYKGRDTIVKNGEPQDSVDYWLESVETNKWNQDQNLEILKRAYSKNERSKQDSLKLKRLSRIAFLFFTNKDTIRFRKLNNEVLRSATKANDSSNLAKAYWNYGHYYLNYEILDSAYLYYSKAAQVFASLNKAFLAGSMLYNTAIIQKDIKDYTGSEITVFEAISNFDKDKHQYNLYLCHNLLGVVYNNLEEYDKSIEAHEKALSYLLNINNNGTLKEVSLNNIGLALQEKGVQDLAIKKFNEALSNYKLGLINKRLYAKLIDNLAYSKFLTGDTLDVEKDFYKSLAIRDSLNNISGILINKLHLSEYYAYKQDTTKAIVFASEACELAESVNNFRDQLVALQLMAKLDHDNSNNYLSRYVKLDDSLQKVERAIRNKFTRIRFETDEYIQQTEKLSLQKTIIILSSITTILILSLLYFIRIQRSRNKQLSLERDQQLANEEIYKLMLAQQYNLEEGRLEERNRISEELHDGVLGKIYGTRMGLGLLDFDGDTETKKQHKSYVTDLQKIEKEIRIISHELKNDILLSKTDYLELIDKLLEEQGKINGFTYKIDEEEPIDWSKVTDSVKMNLYRIIQEIVQNINKHAKATIISLHFSLKENWLNLSVQDNGKGFDPSKPIKGIGIKNMESRIKKLQGKFKISSVIDSSTLVELTIPIDDSNGND